MTNILGPQVDRLELGNIKRGPALKMRVFIQGPAPIYTIIINNIADNNLTVIRRYRRMSGIVHIFDLDHRLLYPYPVDSNIFECIC